MGSRRDGRVLAFRLLYHLELVGGEAEREVERFWELNPGEGEAKEFARALAGRVLAHRDELDRLIAGASERWSLQRMDAVSRCLLRLGACEIFHFPDVPPQVAIHEAVELAKAYGPETSPGFVNAVLDRLNREKTTA